jgi:flagellar biosynthesis protein FlhG
VRKVWTIGGGKGGVGKSFLTASIGISLARQGYSVVVVEADFGAPDLHTFLGVKGFASNEPVLSHARTLKQRALIPTSQAGLSLLSCTGDFIGAADPGPAEIEQIKSSILGLDVDYVLVDTGRGTSLSVLDVFNLGDVRIVVVAPDPAAIQRAYAFIKCSLYRRIQQEFGIIPSVASAIERIKQPDNAAKLTTILEFYDLLCATDPGTTERIAALVDGYRPMIIINMADSEEEQRVGEIVQTACKRFLNVDIRFGGLILQDPAMRRATHSMALPEIGVESCLAARQIHQTVLRVMNSTEGVTGTESEILTAITPMAGLDDRLEFKGKQLRIKTDNMGYTGRCIITQVFCEGRVILSTMSDNASTLHEAGNLDHIKALMHKQHFNVICDIEGDKIQLHNAT